MQNLREMDRRDLERGYGLLLAEVVAARAYTKAEGRMSRLVAGCRVETAALDDARRKGEIAMWELQEARAAVDAAGILEAGE